MYFRHISSYFFILLIMASSQALGMSMNALEPDDVLADEAEFGQPINTLVAGFMCDSEPGINRLIPSTIGLLNAIVDNDAQSVENLLRGGATPNSQGLHGYSLTDIALYKGNPRISHIMQVYGGSSVPGATPLHYAACFGDYELAKYITNKYHEVGPRRQGDITPLHEAAYQGHLEIARLLLEHGADSNAKNAFENTPLHDALSKSHWDIAALLLQYKADLNSADKNKQTAWQLIIKNCANNTETLDNDHIKFLLNAVANHKIDVVANVTPLHCAAYSLNESLVKLLLANNSPVNTRNFLGKTPLYDACAPEALSTTCTTGVPNDILERQQRIVEFLLQNKADPNIPDANGTTPLAIAIEEDSLPLTTILLNYKANPNIPICGYKTLLHYCAAKNKASLLEALLTASPDLNKQDDNGNTPLHISCQNGFEEISHMLLNHDARIDIPDRWGKTASDIDNHEKQVIRNCPRLQTLTLALAVLPRTGRNAYPVNLLSNDEIQIIGSLLKKMYNKPV